MADKYNKLVTSTKYSFLDAKQRSEFQKRWYYLKQMIDKWCEPPDVGKAYDIFCNKKRLEKEVEDLEDVSLSAYRAMKFLRTQLEEISKGDDYFSNEAFTSPKIICQQCCTDITHAPTWTQVYGKYFCDSFCLSEFEQSYESENYSR